MGEDESGAESLWIIFSGNPGRGEAHGKYEAGGIEPAGFEGVCRECPDLKLEDGSLRVFINTKGKNRESFSREFLDFMEYIGKTTDETAENTASQKIRRIHRKVCAIRKSEKAGMKYMQRWEEIAFARAEGKAASILELLGDMEPVPLALREEIMAESSEETLGKWLRMAARAGSIEEFIKRKAEEDSLLEKACMAAGIASGRLPAGENDMPNAAHCFSSSVLS